VNSSHSHSQQTTMELATTYVGVRVYVYESHSTSFEKFYVVV